MKNAKTKKQKVDKALVAKIQPQGGISFKDERITKCGDGYEACLTIFEYPKQLNDFWLFDILSRNGVIATMDISTADMNQVRKNINKSLSEQSARYSTSMDKGQGTDTADAQQRYTELQAIYDNITLLGELVKPVIIRLFVPDRTREKCEETTAFIQNELESHGFKCAVMLCENKNDWSSMFKPYKVQQQGKFARKGQPLTTEHIAYGNPFFFSNLSDPFGTYLGTTTDSGGAVMFDIFHNDGRNRMSYGGVILGKMGSGKSTLLKWLVRDRAVRGDMIRGFDPVGEYRPLVESLGGCVISLDGSGGKLNALEILETDEDQEICLSAHISKLESLYKLLKPSADSEEISEFSRILPDFYEESGIINSDIDTKKQQLTGRPSTEYPIWSDFLKWLTEKVENGKEDADRVKTELLLLKLTRQESICLTIDNLVRSYGYLFDGHTSVKNVVDEQIVFFDIKNLLSMSAAVFDAQMFLALSLCWDNCTRVGIPMKKAYESGELAAEDIKHFMVLIDEAHHCINTDKLPAVKQATSFERQARKYFGGLCFASHNATDFIKPKASTEASEAIKSLFALSQYKFVFRQDETMVSTLKTAFGGQLSEYEYNEIPKLEKGCCTLVISGDKNITFHVYVTDEELALFAGGK
jgi:hypothetical protein